jgi:hypothetical protein
MQAKSAMMAKRVMVDFIVSCWFAVAVVGNRKICFAGGGSRNLLGRIFEAYT